MNYKSFINSLFRYKFVFLICLFITLLIKQIGILYKFEDFNPTVIVYSLSFKNHQSIDLYKDKSIIGEFKSKYNNLGIVSVKFNTHNKINTDFLQFRIKEKGNTEWFYTANYKVDQFQNNKYFPFGFPEISDSKNKTYEFEITSLNGTFDNYISIDSGNNQFLVKNNFSKKFLTEHKTYIPVFVFNKVWSFFQNINLFDFLLLIFESIVLFIFLILVKIPMLLINEKWKNKKENTNNERYFWVDLVKGIAIVSVVLSHLEGVIYTNILISYYTVFCVSLFIFMSGFTSAISIQKKEIVDFGYILKRLKAIFIPYLIATVVYCIYGNRYFDLFFFYNSLITFSASGPLYFVLFYMQLIFVSVYIYKIVNHKKSSYFDIFIIIGVYTLSSIFTSYTKIDVYGGSKVLFGGNYLFLYVLGFYLKKYINFFNNKNISFVLLLISFFLLKTFIKNNLILKSWSNPPNILLVIYTLILFFIFLSLYNLILYRLKKIFVFIAFLGKYSLYIFLYHLFFLKIFVQLFPFISKNSFNPFIGIFILSVILFIPAVIEKFFKSTFFKNFLMFFEYPTKI